jgi:hypothetical protein
MEKGVEMGVDGSVLSRTTTSPSSAKKPVKNLEVGRLDAVRQLLESGQIQSPE